MTITAEELRETIRRELPAMVREDPALRERLGIESYGYAEDVPL